MLNKIINYKHIMIKRNVICPQCRSRNTNLTKSGEYYC